MTLTNTAQLNQVCKYMGWLQMQLEYAGMFKVWTVAGARAKHITEAELLQELITRTEQLGYHPHPMDVSSLDDVLEAVYKLPEAQL